MVGGRCDGGRLRKREAETKPGWFRWNVLTKTATAHANNSPSSRRCHRGGVNHVLDRGQRHLLGHDDDHVLHHGHGRLGHGRGLVHGIGHDLGHSHLSRRPPPRGQPPPPRQRPRRRRPPARQSRAATATHDDIGSSKRPQQEQQRVLVRRGRTTELCISRERSGVCRESIVSAGPREAAAAMEASPGGVSPTRPLSLSPCRGREKEDAGGWSGKRWRKRAEKEGGASDGRGDRGGRQVEHGDGSKNAVGRWRAGVGWIAVGLARRTDEHG